MKRMPPKTGDEQDALTRARRFYHWKRGQLKRIKRAYNKKERKWLQRLLTGDDE